MASKIRTAKKVGKSTEANLPAVNLQACIERFIIIINVDVVRFIYLPDSCQREKYALWPMLSLCKLCYIIWIYRSEIKNRKMKRR